MSKGFRNGPGDARRGIDYIGVTCSFVCHDGNGRFLMHKRSKNCRDEHGNWDNGGGAHEFSATFEETVERESQEEYGVKPSDLRFIKTYDAHRELADGTPTHWVAIVYAAKVDPNEVKNNEPHKIDEIGWFTMDDLPSPLHSQSLHALQSVKDAGLI